MAGVGGEERNANLFTDLEVHLPDGGPEPSLQFLRCHPHGSHHGYQHAARQSAPAGMSRTDRGAVRGRKQHRHAVSHLNRAHPCGTRYRGVSRRERPA